MRTRGHFTFAMPSRAWSGKEGRARPFEAPFVPQDKQDKRAMPLRVLAGIAKAVFLGLLCIAGLLLWAEMLDDDAYQWFEDNGGLTRANGDRFRQMVLSRGNTEDLAKMYAAWRGKDPSVEPMLKYRGLLESAH